PCLGAPPRSRVPSTSASARPASRPSGSSGKALSGQRAAWAFVPTASRCPSPSRSALFTTPASRPPSDLTPKTVSTTARPYVREADGPHEFMSGARGSVAAHDRSQRVHHLVHRGPGRLLAGPNRHHLIDHVHCLFPSRRLRPRFRRLE